MKKLTKKSALCISWITLFVACALSMYAMFKGDPFMLVISAIFFAIGFFALQHYMSL
ncbi:hypothetical protein [Allobaculum stercoricanis]|uniref:hypothetical protein n=1 Tax=Allobaculum stercoricanis TaxID=174709 RepID=UPI0023F03C41|nr:hypothetical protein [Allobaculum stercoricanis]